jgi:hypothetical protein
MEPRDLNNHAEHLRALHHLGIGDLRNLWQQVFRQPAPPHIRKGLLVRSLAYRIQARTYGVLPRASLNRLRKIVEDVNQGATPTLANAPRIKLGTRLIRQWQGETHEVTLLEAGYAYRGQRYASLSEIARLITGTRWSGPLFFGLKTVERNQGEGRRHVP